MELTEHIAAFLRANGYSHACGGVLPQSPDRAQAVVATGVRPRSDGEGSRFQVVVRGTPQSEDALADAMDIADLLDDFSGITSPDSPWFARIQLESGAANLGADENRRLMYSLNFRAWYC